MSMRVDRVRKGTNIGLNQLLGRGLAVLRVCHCDRGNTWIRGPKETTINGIFTKKIWMQ
jgi:hypothetical protein